jgi:hypothetical protein
MVYDVFGLYIQTLKGADILASGYAPANDTAGDFKVFMPDFFGDHPQSLANFPPKTPPQYKAIIDFMTGPADPAKTVPLVAPMMEEIKKKHPEITSWVSSSGLSLTLIFPFPTKQCASPHLFPKLHKLYSLLQLETCRKKKILTPRSS